MPYDPLQFVTDLRQPYQEAHARGVARLRLLPVDWVEWMGLPEPPDVAMATLPAGWLALKPGKSPVEVGVNPDTCTYSDEQVRDGSGVYWRAAIQAVAQKIKPSVLAWLEQNAQVELLGLVLDVAGQARLVGNLETPVRLVQAVTQTAKGGTGGSNFTLSALTAQPAYFLKGISDGDVLGTRRFSYRYPLRCQ